MALFVLSLCPFDISVGIGAFVIGLGQISSFLSLTLTFYQQDGFYVVLSIFLISIPLDKGHAPGNLWKLSVTYLFKNAVIYFRFEVINTVLHETNNQRNVEVIDNITYTTSPFCILSKKIMFLTWSISIKCKVLHLCPAYLDKLPFSNLNQAYSFSCHILSLMA